MNLIAEGMTWPDFFHANWGWFAAALLAIGTAIMGGFSAIGRAGYLVYEKSIQRKNERDDARAVKENKALDTMAETLPRLAEANEKTADTLRILTEKESDVVKTQVALHGAVVDLADCMVLNACPEMQERFKRDTDRVKNRIKGQVPKARPDAPEDFLDRHKS